MPSTNVGDAGRRKSGEPAPLAFDYSVIGVDAAALAQWAADSIRNHVGSLSKTAIAIGLDLIKVQEALGHGRFGEWLRAEFGWTERTAYNYMQAARVFGAKSETVSELPDRVIYKLASPSTPQPVRETVVSRLEAGERLPVAEVDHMVADAREKAKAEREEAKLSPEQRKRKAARLARERRERAEGHERWQKRQAEKDQRHTAALQTIARHFGTAAVEELIVILEGDVDCLSPREIGKAAGIDMDTIGPDWREAAKRRIRPATIDAAPLAAEPPKPASDRAVSSQTPSDGDADDVVPPHIRRSWS
jgi:hypothetical protein